MPGRSSATPRLRGGLRSRGVGRERLLGGLDEGREGRRLVDREVGENATVDLDALVEKGLLKNTKTDVKVLGSGELTKKLSVTVHSFSASAREQIAAAGGTATALKEPKERKRKQRAKPVAAPDAEADAEPEAPEAEADTDSRSPGEES